MNKMFYRYVKVLVCLENDGQGSEFVSNMTSHLNPIYEITSEDNYLLGSGISGTVRDLRSSSPMEKHITSLPVIHEDE